MHTHTYPSFPLRQARFVFSNINMFHLSGMDRGKLKQLLHEAYSDLEPALTETKVNKRMLLFGDA